MDAPPCSQRRSTHGSRRVGTAADGIHLVESDQVIDPRRLGYFTDSLTGSDRLHLDTGTSQEAPATLDVEAVQGQSRDGMAHHPSRPDCPETGGVGMPTDPEIARLSKNGVPP